MTLRTLTLLERVFDVLTYTAIATLLIAFTATCAAATLLTLLGALGWSIPQ